MRWIAWFSALSMGLVGVVLFALWAWTGFEGFGISVRGTIALVVGGLLTVALAVGLMALVFHSARTGQDERTHGAGLGEGPPDHRGDRP
ncbi:MAG TPA: hypothetical protein VEB20_14025 [Azospirillaceae bacterium]|nr:hypothetical protein [Azospirillaceae bacterium]